jgi:hypothetical protein
MMAFYKRKVLYSFQLPLFKFCGRKKIRSSLQPQARNFARLHEQFRMTQGDIVISKCQPLEYSIQTI